MFVKFLMISIFALLPMSALAADLGPATSGSSSLSQPAESGGSNADGSALQPAGNNPLQSTTNDSTGLTAPNSNSLQAPADANTDLKVILGNEADGLAHEITNDSLAQTEQEAFVGGALLLLIIVGVLTFRSLRKRKFRPDYLDDVSTEPVVAETPSEQLGELKTLEAEFPSESVPPQADEPVVTDADSADARTPSVAPKSKPKHRSKHKHKSKKPR